MVLINLVISILGKIRLVFVLFLFLPVGVEVEHNITGKAIIQVIYFCG